MNSLEKLGLDPDATAKDIATRITEIDWDITLCPSFTKEDTPECNDCPTCYAQLIAAVEQRGVVNGLELASEIAADSAKYYSTAIFHEIPEGVSAEVHKAFPSFVDCNSAAMGRHTLATQQRLIAEKIAEVESEASHA